MTKLLLLHLGKAHVDRVDTAGDVRWLYTQSHCSMHQSGSVQVYLYTTVLCYIIHLETECSP